MCLVAGVSSLALANQQAPVKNPSIASAASGSSRLTPFEASALPEPVVNVPSAGTPITSAADAVARVLTLKANSLRVDSIKATLVTFGQLMGPGGPAANLSEMPAGFTLGQKVWAVVVVGEYRPQFTKSDTTYRWGIEILDAETGVPLSSFAGHQALPELFAS